MKKCRLHGAIFFGIFIMFVVVLFVLYFSPYPVDSTKHDIELNTLECVNGKISIVVTNLERDYTIDKDDLVVWINDTNKTIEYPNLTPIKPLETKTDTGTSTYSGPMIVQVVTPSNRGIALVNC